MDAGSYLHWLRTTDLDLAVLSDLKEAVEIILGALQRELAEHEAAGETVDFEMLHCLQEIFAELNHGCIPLGRIEAFRNDFFEDVPAQSPEAVLEQELREIAAGINPEKWSTETYQKLEKAIHGFLDGGEEEALWSTVDEIDSILEESYESYRTTGILPKEVTVESVVCHKILFEGICWWKDAVNLLRDGDDDVEPDWSDVLQHAEMGNRLLVTVQVFNDRLQRAV
jgi:hypothetical protein